MRFTNKTVAQIKGMSNYQGGDALRKADHAAQNRRASRARRHRQVALREMRQAAGVEDLQGGFQSKPPERKEKKKG